ncbi:MAG: peptide chain release factor N(5)-glutamine methyltransferase [Candidatus Latescibacterota bacterium]|nr:MAG: peptide chain release factor N(5)-glutamine methyltransferase [Candidatus Latescibacterota bacterium]
MIADSPDVLELLRRAESYLNKRGVPNARRNAEWMMSYTLGCRSQELYIDPHRLLDYSQSEKFDRLVERRGAREPLQYILESTEFMSLPFRTLPGVFIPRPDTELLVERVEASLPPVVLSKKGSPLADEDSLAILDLCCGTGVIVVSLVRRNPGVNGVAVDIDPTAADLTKANANLNGVGGRIRCVESEAREFLKNNSRLYDAIVCNPPYVRTGDIPRLPPEIRAHEPAMSLDGGPDGLDFYRKIIPLMIGAVRSRGIVAFEIGEAQGGPVAEMLRAASLIDVEIHKDYNGLDRVITGRKA